MGSRTLRFILCVIISGLVGYYLGVTRISLDWKHYKPPTFSSKEPPATIQNVDFSQFWRVYQDLQDQFYDKSALDPQKMLTGAITGMVNSLDDPYTMYLPPQQNNDFKQQLSGQFEGIGAELGMNGKQVVVIAPLDSSPAQKAGLKAGDVVLKVNDEDITGWDLNKIVGKIRGPKGTPVTLSIMHKNQTKPEDVKITRDAIQVKSVALTEKKVSEIDSIDQKNISGDKNAKVAYIRLAQFGDNTNQEWLAITSKLAVDMKTDTSIKGVILDLRNNPGGLLNDAVFIASEFIDSGVVVKEQGAETHEDSVSRKGVLVGVPLVVIINKGTASASEILTGALHDHGVATLVGENSFGKGIMQAPEDLGGGAGLHITVAKWLTPNGTWVGNGKNGEGIKPDYVVALDQKDPTHDTQLEKAVQVLLTK